MVTIQLGNKIARKRKERGLTQEELAHHLGVSKPAVSKWESGQSYPDILLLPVLASYFNISVDELIGYEPQMLKEDIRKLYHSLAEQFVHEPFEDVYELCKKYLKEYYSCWQLQVQIGLLLINHLAQTDSLERKNEVIYEILQLFQRVENSCDEVILVKEVLQYQALCYLMLNQAADAVDILEKLSESMMSADSLLIKAYQMKGDNKKARELLQGYVYRNLMELIDSCTDFLQLYADQPDRMEAYYFRFLELSILFQVDQMNPSVLFKVHLSAAALFMTQGQKGKALDALEQFVNLVKHIDKKHFYLKGNDYFDEIEDYFASSGIDANTPRSVELIWKDLKDIVSLNPAFQGLAQEERFQKIIRTLERE